MLPLAVSTLGSKQICQPLTNDCIYGLCDFGVLLVKCVCILEQGAL